MPVPERGIALFDTEASPGCALTCYVGNNAAPPVVESAVNVAGQAVRQIEFDRSASLGPEPRAPLYREWWTALDGGRGLVMIIGFWPKDDVAAAAEVRSAYAGVLGSLRFTPVAQPSPLGSTPTALPATP